MPNLVMLIQMDWSFAENMHAYTTTSWLPSKRNSSGWIQTKTLETEDQTTASNLTLMIHMKS